MTACSISVQSYEYVGTVERMTACSVSVQSYCINSIVERMTACSISVQSYEQFCRKNDRIVSRDVNVHKTNSFFIPDF
jgi:hypothetical protein